MTRIPLTQGFYQARSVIANAQRCLNLYPEVNADDGPAPMTCYPTPGLLGLSHVGSNAEVRGLYVASNNQGYAVIGNTVYTVQTDFSLTSVGTLVTSAGPVYFSDNGTTIVIIDESTKGYQLDLKKGSVVTSVIDPTGSFIGSVNVGFLDSFFLFSAPNTNRLYTSLSNEVTFDPLYTVARSAAPDYIAGLAVCQRIIWVIGQKTTECWYDAGNPDFPFAEIQGAFFQVGCVSSASIAVSDVYTWWLGQNAQGQGIVYQGSGGTVVRISTHAIETLFQSFIYIGDAKGFTYQQQGHVFYVLTFPSADKTFVYDATTQLWHERAWIDNNGLEHRHRMNCIANMYGKIVVGDWQNGVIYEMSPKYFTDNGQSIRRIKGFPHLPQSFDYKTGITRLEGHRIRYDQFLADMEVGVVPAILESLGNTVTAINPQYTIAFTNPPTAGVLGTQLTFNGTVTPAGEPVQIAFSSSATVPPIFGSASTDPPVAGTIWGPGTLTVGV